MRPSKRDELVRKSLAVFYRDGFHATGMDTLVAETGISKTTMFKHFRTKDDLILAVLRYRDETFRNWFLRRLDERDLSPRQKLLAVFDILKEWFEEPGFKGCMFIKHRLSFRTCTPCICPVHRTQAPASVGTQEPCGKGGGSRGGSAGTSDPPSQGGGNRCRSDGVRPGSVRCGKERGSGADRGPHPGKLIKLGFRSEHQKKAGQGPALL